MRDIAITITNENKTSCIRGKSREKRKERLESVVFQIARRGELGEAAPAEITTNLATLAVRVVDCDANHDGLLLLAGVRHSGYSVVPVAHLEHFSGNGSVLPGEYDAALVLEVCIDTRHECIRTS